jgi:BASS family bile acid:Na+ symporter
MDTKQLLVLAFQVAIVGTVFTYGLRTTLDDVLYLMRRPGLLVRSLLSVFVVMPVLAVILVKVFDIRTTTEVVLVALAISPIPPLMPKNERKAGGHAPYALALMALLAVAAIPLVPLAVEVLGWAFDRPFATAPGRIAKIVLVMIVAPLVVGMIVRAALPRVAARLQAPNSKVATILLLLAALVLLAVTWRAIWSATGGGTILALVVFIAVGLTVGHLLGGPEPEHSTVLAMSTACRHPAIALTIAAAAFPQERFAGTIILYVLLNTVLWMAYAAWQRRRTESAAVA